MTGVVIIITISIVIIILGALLMFLDVLQFVLATLFIGSLLVCIISLITAIAFTLLGLDEIENINPTIIISFILSGVFGLIVKSIPN